MTQHAMTIANQAGASFRADLNNMALAIASLNSGATAPATTYSYMWWADTTTGLLKQRNAANSAWITHGKLADLGIQTGAQNIATVGGTVDAITLTLDPVPTALFAGPKWWRAAGANATTTPSVNTAGLGVKTLVKGNNVALVAGDIPGAGAWMCSQYDATLGKEVLMNPATGVSVSSSVQVPVRQTVLSGPVDANGFPTFLPATSVNLNLTSQNISTGVNALVATAAGGANGSGAINAVGQATANLTWTGHTASQTNYLPVSIAAGVLTALTPVILAPIYQWGGTPAVTAGQYTYNIQQGIMWLGNGTTASAVNHVIAGEAVAGASTITSTVAYAYQGRYDSGYIATLPSQGTSTAKNHNLGVDPIWTFTAKNTTTDQGYSVGEILTPQSYNTGSQAGLNSVSANRLTMYLQSGATSTGWLIPLKTTGTAQVTTNASWSYRLTANRGW